MLKMGGGTKVHPILVRKYDNLGDLSVALKRKGRTEFKWFRIGSNHGLL
jgi:hypothetical protein